MSVETAGAFAPPNQSENRIIASQGFSAQDGPDTAEAVNKYVQSATSRNRSILAPQTVLRVLTPDHQAVLLANRKFQVVDQESESLVVYEKAVYRPELASTSKLRKTGFNTDLEYQRAVNNFNLCLDQGMSPEQAWQKTVGEIDINIRTFAREYIQAGLVLPHANRLDVVDGQVRMVGFNGVPVVDGVTDKERRGSVLEASVKIEDFLLQSKAGDAIVLNSPAGWSGFRKEDGSSLEYGNSQVMVFWKTPEEQLKGVTLVTDLRLEQSIQLSEQLGVESDLLAFQSKEEIITNVVKNPAKLSFPSSDYSPAEYVLDKIAAIRGQGDMLFQIDNKIKSRQFAELATDLKRVDELLRFDQQSEACMSQLTKLLLADLSLIQDSGKHQTLFRLMENTIIAITNEQLDSGSKSVDKGATYNRQGPTPDITKVTEQDARRSVEYLEKQIGCNGGGASSVGVSVMGGFSQGLSLGRELSFKLCKDCGRSESDNHYHCPSASCKERYEDETNKKVRTAQCKCGFKFGC